mgnify:CR=1 FL=1
MNTPLKVLILEDNPDDARLNIHEMRQAGFAPEWTVVDTMADFLTALESAPDVIISDFNIPHFDCMRALQIIRERGLETPFIIVSGSIGEDIAVAAMRQGATDYLIKDRLGRLGQAITQALENKRIKIQQRELEKTLHLRDRAIASLSQGLVIADSLQPDNPIIFANPGFEKLTGYTQAEILDREQQKRRDRDVDQNDRDFTHHNTLPTLTFPFTFATLTKSQKQACLNDGVLFQ